MSKHQFAICIDNRGYEVSLEIRKLYEVLPDANAEKHAQIRVIDESGKDYLYPAAAFTCISLPDNVVERVISTHAS
ncbi:MAG: hypothetical protein JSR32_04085 [Proteobacteria bacterium]|nr:hypothetical protein [Pseudomonadota bacterium]